MVDCELIVVMMVVIVMLHCWLDDGHMMAN